ncbi:unnamed protein product [Spirodela intermedia]|uniref:Uncharacterized protein n=1 Tax=Spirodela intermedia TaxID=51605 RepID=A0ABN7EB38_SPIIN|nr:unnamed protein product [Spirodela intermedia]
MYIYYRNQRNSSRREVKRQKVFVSFKEHESYSPSSKDIS